MEGSEALGSSHWSLCACQFCGKGTERWEVPGKLSVSKCQQAAHKSRPPQAYVVADKIIDVMLCSRRQVLD